MKTLIIFLFIAVVSLSLVAGYFDQLMKFLKLPTKHAFLVILLQTHTTITSITLNWQLAITTTIFFTHTGSKVDELLNGQWQRMIL